MSNGPGRDVEATYAANLDEALAILRTKIAEADFGGNSLQDPNNTMVYVRTRAILQEEPRPFKEVSSKRRVYYGQGTVNVTGRQVIIDQRNGVTPRSLKVIIGNSASPVDDVAASIRVRLGDIADRLELRMLVKEEQPYSHHVSNKLAITFKQPGMTRKEDKALHRVITWHSDERIDEDDIHELAGDYETMLTWWKTGRLERQLRAEWRKRLREVLRDIQGSEKANGKKALALDRPITGKLGKSKRDSNIWHAVSTWKALGHFGNEIEYTVKGTMELSLDGMVEIDISRSEIENKLKRSQNLEKIIKKKGVRIAGPTMCLARGKESIARELVKFIEDKPADNWRMMEGNPAGQRLSVSKGLISYNGPFANQAYLDGEHIILQRLLPETIASALPGKGVDVLTGDPTWKDEIIESVTTHNTSTTIYLTRQEIPVEEALVEFRCLGSAAQRPQQD